MNPKKESTIRSKLLSIFESDRAKHYKGAAEAETMDDKYKGAGAKKMAKDHKVLLLILKNKVMMTHQRPAEQ